jgi:MFS family permease
MLSSAPRLLLMLFGGVIADRFDVRRLMIGSDVLRTVVTAGAALLALARPGIALLAVLALVFGVVDAVFQPSAGALQPRLLRPGQYAGGAVLANLTGRLALAAGAPLGGVLLAVGGLPSALTVDAATFAVSVATLLTVRPRPAAAANAGRAAPPKGFVWADLRAGLSFLVRHPVLGPLTLGSLPLNVGFVGPMNIGIAELADHRGWGAAGIGVLLAGFGLGAAAGGLLTMKWRIRRNAGIWIAVLCAVEGVCLFAVAVAPGVALATAGTSIIGVTGVIIAVAGPTGDFALGGLIELSVLLTLLAPAYRRARVED